MTPERVAGLRLRRHGAVGPTLIVLHGGPAAVGSVAPIAQGLADRFRVLEPWQRGSGGAPLSVVRHVSDLHDLVKAECGAALPALVGWSWGAMLALAYAAAHPTGAGAIALVGSGTFDVAARDRMKAIIDERTSDEVRQQIAQLDEEIADPGERLARKYELLGDFDTYEAADPHAPKVEEEPFDARAHRETWDDMLRLQAGGVYPVAFEAISSPVLMLHGDYDPHPGRMIRDSLAPYLPQLEYRELACCGHSPWVELHAREAFFRELRAWLDEQFAARARFSRA